MNQYTSLRGFIHTGAIEDLAYFRSLYLKIQEHEKDRIEWDYIKHGVEHALLYFGHFHDWLKIQLEGPYLYGRRYEFIEDTICFILTGVRKISILNWASLLDPMPERNRRFTNQLDPILHRIPTNQPTIDILAQWCAQPNGFIDMICTLDILVSEPDTQDLLAR